MRTNLSSVDRSKETASRVLEEAIKSASPPNVQSKELTRDLLKIGFSFQFENDRTIPRRKISELLTNLVMNTKK
jgi:hypothetical protein